jgi:hypothetical protein
MPLPTFLLIGAQKAATTTLWAMLNEHPDVFIPAIKETNFLIDAPDHFPPRSLEWYEALYEPARGLPQRGDASTGYSMFPIFPGVAERAASLLPEARIVYMIRHPLERLVSAWTHAVAHGAENRSLHQAVMWGAIYRVCSCYGLQLSRWRAFFPSEAVLVIRSEDLAADPGPTLDRVLGHLGLEPGWRPADPDARLNESSPKLRTIRGVQRVAGALRGAGFDRAAMRLAQADPLKARTGLARSFEPAELELPQEMARALMDSFRADFAVLRDLVRDEIDLYGLA